MTILQFQNHVLLLFLPFQGCNIVAIKLQVAQFEFLVFLVDHQEHPEENQQRQQRGDDDDVAAQKMLADNVHLLMGGLQTIDKKRSPHSRQSSLIEHGVALLEIVKFVKTGFRCVTTHQIILVGKEAYLFLNIGIVVFVHQGLELRNIVQQRFGLMLHDRDICQP